MRSTEPSALTSPLKESLDIYRNVRGNFNNTDQVLRLLDDTRVNFDNNTAERAPRMVNLHDKISGCFHSLAGAEAFAAICSYLQTANNHNQNLLGVLHRLFTYGPGLPPNPTQPT